MSTATLQLNAARVSTMRASMAASRVAPAARLGAAPKKGTKQMQRVNAAGGASAAPVVTSNGAPAVIRDITRFAIPSKGRMAEDTQDLLQACQLKVKKTNPRQYIAKMTNVPGMEVWFQRASDVVRRLRAGDVDLGILGGDMFEEFGEDDPELVVIHDSLNFGHCHLSLGVPTAGKWENIHTLDDLKRMPEFTPENPLRVVTGYQHIAKKYFEKVGMTSRVQLLAADGALEAAPQMNYADIILDLVSTGTTLRENNLKELEGAVIMESEGVLVARRTALLQQPETLAIVREMLERVEAHLKAEAWFTVVVNMRGESAEDVAQKLIAMDPLLAGLQGPTVSQVFSRNGSGVSDGEFYGVTVCIPKNRLYESVKKLRSIGGSGIMVSPLTYIFDEQPARWDALLTDLGIDNYDDFKPGAHNK